MKITKLFLIALLFTPSLWARESKIDAEVGVGGYETPGHYIEFHNLENTWIDYDSELNQWIFSGNFIEIEDALKEYKESMFTAKWLIIMEIIRELKDSNFHLTHKVKEFSINGKIHYLTEHEYNEILLVPCWSKGIDCPLSKSHKFEVIGRVR